MDTQDFTKMKVMVSVREEKYPLGIVIPVQTHSNNVRVIETGTEDLSNSDALITMNPEITVGVHTADCAPVCFSDGERIAVAHAGWRGLCANILEGVLEHFDPEQTEIFVGPHLHTFEIQRDSCYETITQKFGEEFLSEEGSKIVFHFKDAIASCLPSQALFDSRNTANDIRLPSYRHKRMFGNIITSTRLTTL